MSKPNASSAATLVENKLNTPSCDDLHGLQAGAADGSGGGGSGGRADSARRRSAWDFLNNTMVQTIGGLLTIIIVALVAKWWQRTAIKAEIRATNDARVYEMRREAFSEFCDQFPRALARAYDMMQAHAAVIEHKSSIPEDQHSSDAELAELRIEFRDLKKALLYSENGPTQPHALIAKCEAVFDGLSPAERAAAAVCNGLYQTMNTLIRCDHANPPCQGDPSQCIEHHHNVADAQYDEAVKAMGQVLLKSRLQQVP